MDTVLSNDLVILYGQLLFYSQCSRAHNLLQYYSYSGTGQGCVLRCVNPFT